MISRLVLVCSGGTRETRKGIFPLDEPIEKKSALRAARLANRLPNSRRCWTSPALRARQTVEGLSLQAVEMQALRDQDFGRWVGKSLAEVEISDREGLSRLFCDPGAAPHGGESMLDVSERVSNLLDHLLGEAGCTIAVTHPAVIRAAVVRVLGAPAQCVWRIDIEPLSVTDFRGDGRRWTLRSSAWL